MFKYKIINFPKSFLIQEKILDKIFEKIQQIVLEKKQKWTLNIVFVSEEEIKELNKNYRQKDYVTDVLSFHYFEDFSKLKQEETAWEIILTENKIIEQWKEYKLWSELEFYKLVIHSSLHILWFDHEIDSDFEIMKTFEEKIWEKVFG